MTSREFARELFERSYRARDARDLREEHDLTAEEADEVYLDLMKFEAIEDHWEDIRFMMDDNIRAEVEEKYGEDSDRMLLLDAYMDKDPSIWEFIEEVL